MSTEQKHSKPLTVVVSHEGKLYRVLIFANEVISIVRQGVGIHINPTSPKYISISALAKSKLKAEAPR